MLLPDYSVAVITGQDDWAVTYTPTQVCAFKGSAVNVSCTFTYPSAGSTEVEKGFWFMEGRRRTPVDLTTETGHAGRVEYGCRDHECTLTISDLRASDSAEYRFTTKLRGFTGSPGVSLSVTDLWVQVTRGFWVWTVLRCHSSCDVAADPSYVWYKNKQEMSKKTSTYVIYFNDKNSYSCAVEGHENYCSSPVPEIDLPSVSVSPSEIVEGSSVTLNCSSDANPAASYTWYKKNQPRPHGEEPQLVFSSIQSSDSGQYLCEAENHLGKKRSEFISIDVKYGPRLPSVSVSPSEIVEGSSVTLTCSSDANPAASYTWYKKNQTRPHGEGDIYRFTSISSEDRGIYYCKAENKHGEINSSSLFLNVQCEYNTLEPKTSPSSL
uniref:Ig-like domain-containing protein n=1 Tax=Cyclopterus lumpus TaxID=8103 RepID=A0A8C2XMV1_CYCLU